MAKKNLLQITQSVLSSMNSDSVNSINDLEESIQIAEKAQEVYEDLMVLEDWEHLRTLLQLESLSDSERPNYLKIPELVSEILDIQYDKRKLNTDRKKFEPVMYKSPEDFMNLIISRDDTEDNITTVTDINSSVALFIRNDHAPTYWTSFDEEHIVFDSYDSSIDSVVQQSKNFTRGTKEVLFTLSDNYIPDLPSKMFPAYLQEVTRICSVYFREQPSANDERRAFRSMARQKNSGTRTQKRKVSYGRK